MIVLPNQPNEKDVTWLNNQLRRWFRDYGRNFPWRKKSATLYQKIVAEVLLQRTRAEMIHVFYPHFIRRFPSWKSLSAASEQDLESFLKPIGLWHQRASSLHRLALEMVKRRGRFPKEREALEALPGIGQYIANAVLLFQYKEPQALLDVNMARVLERFFGPRQLADIRYDPYLQALSKSIVMTNAPAEINWAILDFAAIMCKTSQPRCNLCPVQARCRFFKDVNRTDTA